MVKLKEIGVLSYGYIAAIILAIGSFFYALLIVPMLSSFLSILGSSGDIPGLESFAGAGGIPGWVTLILIIVLPIFGAINGFIAGCIGALIYNLAAKITGGIEMDFVKAPPSRRKAARRRHSNVIIEEEPVAGMENTNNDEDTEYTEDVVEIAEE